MSDNIKIAVVIKPGDIVEGYDASDNILFTAEDSAVISLRTPSSGSTSADFTADYICKSNVSVEYTLYHILPLIYPHVWSFTELSQPLFPPDITLS